MRGALARRSGPTTAERSSACRARGRRRRRSHRRATPGSRRCRTRALRPIRRWRRRGRGSSPRASARSAEHVGRLGGEADEEPVALALAELGEDVGGAHELERERRRVLLQLVGPGARGPEVRDRRGSRRRRRPRRRPTRTASCICSAVVTRTISTPNGSGSAVGPLTSVTRAPRRAASSAIA